MPASTQIKRRLKMRTGIEEKLIEEQIQGKQNLDELEELTITLEHEGIFEESGLDEESDICDGPEVCPKWGLDLTSIDLGVSKQPVEEGGNDTYYQPDNYGGEEWEASVIMKCKKCGYILTDKELQKDEKGSMYKDIKLVDFGILIRVYVNQGGINGNI
jgi:hypothetical protein